MSNKKQMQTIINKEATNSEVNRRPECTDPFVRVLYQNKN